MRRIALLTVLLGSTLLAPGRTGIAGDSYALVGQRAPEIQVHTWIGGEGHTRLSDFRGEVVLLHFWATTCRACDAAVRPLSKLQEDHRRKGLHVVAITGEDEDTVLRHLLRQDQPQTFAIGLGHAPEYDVTAVPHAYLVGTEGEVVWEGHPGSLPRRTLRKALSDVRAPTAEEQSATDTHHLERAQALAEAGRLSDAVAALERLVQEREGTETATVATERLTALRSPENEAELAAQERLRELLADDGYPPTDVDDRERAALLRRLAKFERRHAETAPVATRLAREWIERLETPDDE